MSLASVERIVNGARVEKGRPVMSAVDQQDDAGLKQGHGKRDEVERLGT